jgi:hypothetical protein
VGPGRAWPASGSIEPLTGCETLCSAIVRPPSTVLQFRIAPRQNPDLTRAKSKAVGGDIEALACRLRVDAVEKYPISTGFCCRESVFRLISGQASQPGGEHQARIAMPLTQAGRTLHLLEDRVNAAPLS